MLGEEPGNPWRLGFRVSALGLSATAKGEDGIGVEGSAFWHLDGPSSSG